MLGTQRLDFPRHHRDVTFKAAPKHRAAKAENLSLNLAASPEDPA